MSFSVTSAILSLINICGFHGCLRVAGIEEPDGQDPGNLPGADGNNRRCIPGNDASARGFRPPWQSQGFILGDVLTSDLDQEFFATPCLTIEGVRLARECHHDGDGAVIPAVAIEHHQEGGELIAAARAGRFRAGSVLGRFVKHNDRFSAGEYAIEKTGVAAANEAASCSAVR